MLEKKQHKMDVCACQALKIVHRRVLDTAMLFPHKHGGPGSRYKNKLKYLAQKYLDWDIQSSVRKGILFHKPRCQGRHDDDDGDSDSDSDSDKLQRHLLQHFCTVADRVSP